MVQIAVPKSILAAALSVTPELIGLGLGKSGGKTRLLGEAEKADAIVLGPGLGQSPHSEAMVDRLVRMKKPMVVDADALNCLAAMDHWPKHFKASAVLTPHPGEMARLAHLFGCKEIPTSDQGRMDIARAAFSHCTAAALFSSSHTGCTA